jgi:predicted transcriptional regulator
MGAPIVRRDELETELAKLRKERRAGKAKASDPDLAFITRRDLAIVLAPILAALEIDVEEPALEEPALEIDVEEPALEIDVEEPALEIDVEEPALEEPAE